VSISLLADADLNFAIMTGTRLRDSRIDFLSAAEATLQGISDPEVLTFAERQGRILVSHDTSTDTSSFARALRDGKKSPRCISGFTGNRSPRGDRGVGPSLVSVPGRSNGKTRSHTFPHWLDTSFADDSM